MFVLQSKDALVVTKTGREVKRTGNLTKKKAQNKSEVKNPNCTATNPLFVLFGTPHGYQPQNTRYSDAILTNISCCSYLNPRLTTVAHPDAILTDIFCIYHSLTSRTSVDALVFVYACFPNLDRPSRTR